MCLDKKCMSVGDKVCLSGQEVYACRRYSLCVLKRRVLV